MTPPKTETAYETLAQKVFMSALQDVVRLQHPKARRSRELREAYSSAVDMIFDDSFRFHDRWLNEEEEPMSLSDFVKVASGRGNVDLEKLRTFVKEAAESYWQKEDLCPVKIPLFLNVDSHVYHVLVADVAKPIVEEETMTIWIPVEPSPRLAEDFLIVTAELLLAHQEAQTCPKAQAKQLGSMLFRLLRNNDCFRINQ